MSIGQQIKSIRSRNILYLLGFSILCVIIFAISQTCLLEDRTYFRGDSINRVRENYTFTCECYGFFGFVQSCKLRNLTLLGSAQNSDGIFWISTLEEKAKTFLYTALGKHFIESGERQVEQNRREREEIAARVIPPLMGILEGPTFQIGTYFAKKDGVWAPLKHEDLSLYMQKILLDEKDWSLIYDGRKLGNAMPVILMPVQPIPVKFPVGPVTFHLKEGYPLEQKIKELWKENRAPFVVYASSVSDPENWKRGKLPSNLDQLVRRQYVNHMKTILQDCEIDPKNDLVIHPRSFVSSTKAYLVGVGAPAIWEKCTNPRDDIIVGLNLWFFKSEDSSEFLLIGDGFSPVDAADFDGDGKTEWIFVREGQRGLGSYILFSENFQKRISPH
jgi:hypothetical protein